MRFEAERLIINKMPLAELPLTAGRFGKPLELRRVHWVKPELVAAVEYLTWTADGVLRQVTYQGLREDKPASNVVREGAIDLSQRQNRKPLL